ncbi:MAG: GNAT family N-acetyltransferase [Chloroflexi bacterium]|nr:GNAT family N-acetyltransferase [Chloroflexota bacterium]
MSESEVAVKVTIRAMRASDVQSIIEVDRKITGRERSVTWHKRVETYLAADPLISRVAEVDGKVVGFIIGDIKGWEYGVPESGWMEITGVDPEYQRDGVGRMLAESLLDQFRRSGVKSVHTMVEWSDGGIIAYLRALGFKRSEFIDLEMEV